MGFYHQSRAASHKARVKYSKSPFTAFFYITQKKGVPLMTNYFSLIALATILLFIFLLIDWISFMLFVIVLLLLVVLMLIVGISELKKR